jgi:hypothetical protein
MQTLETMSATEFHRQPMVQFDEELDSAVACELGEKARKEDAESLYRIAATFIAESAMTEQQRCAHCSNTGTEKNPLMKCGVCKATAYCSKACQRKKWPMHKAACSPPEAESDVAEESTGKD